MARSSPLLPLPFLAVASFLAAPPAAAYPIPPVPLWDLVRDADLIVVAKVVEIVEAPPRGDGEPYEFDPDLARLRVLETWKGPRRGAVEVKFSLGLICPAPPQFVAGETVTAFLERHAEGGWHVGALSYGTLYFPPERLDEVRALVARALVLQRGRAHPRHVLAWHVEAASRRATRWHGLYPLAPQGDELHSFYDRRSGRRPLGPLTPEDLARIADGFVAEPSMDVTLPLVLAALGRHPDPRVDATAAAAVAGLLEMERIPWWTAEALRRLLERFGERDAATLVKALEVEWELEPAMTRAFWEQARRELGIPDVAPLRWEAPKVRGVGETTPD